MSEGVSRRRDVVGARPGGKNSTSAADPGRTGGCHTREVRDVDVRVYPGRARVRSSTLPGEAPNLRHTDTVTTVIPCAMEVIWSTQCQEAAAIGRFQYLEDYELIICREHGYALRNMNRHLLDYHTYPRDVRKAIIQRFNGLPCRLPEHARLPKAFGSPVDTIAAPRRGFACEEEECNFISTCRTRIAQHCNRHGWKSMPGEREHWADVWVQSFCLTPGKQRWFIVTVDSDPAAKVATSLPEDVQAQKEAISRDAGELRAERKLQLEVLDAEIAKTDQTGWWKRTDWVTHLGESNLRHLAHAARLPGKDEPALQKVADAVDQMVEDCVKGLASLPQEIRRWLKSAKMEEVDQRPMGRLQNQDSQDRYVNYWKRLICYSLRVAQSETEENQTEYHEEEDQDSADDDGATQTIVRRDKMKDARRLYPWRDGQKERARRILHSAETGSGSVVCAILDFSQSFIFHKVYHKPFESP